MDMHKFIATFFGSGYWPWGPGTAGSALGVIVWYLLFCHFDVELVNPWFDQLLLITLVTIIGTWSTSHVQKEWGKDPSKVVVDEAIGMWITLFMVPCNWKYILAAFVLFRLFDITKPLGIRKTENYFGAFGVILDDIVAGVYARIIMAGLLYYSVFG